MQDNQQFYRSDIAKWYNITDRALRDRMQRADIHIANRILTDDDIKIILRGLGKPQCFPLELNERFFGSNVT